MKLEEVRQFLGKKVSFRYVHPAPPCCWTGEWEEDCEGILEEGYAPGSFRLDNQKRGVFVRSGYSPSRMHHLQEKEEKED
jgi:hypothetical protein